MEINEKYIKISGKFPIKKTLELGKEVVVMIKGSCVKSETMDLQDGEVDMNFIVKPTDIEIVEEK